MKVLCERGFGDDFSNETTVTDGDGRVYTIYDPLQLPPNWDKDPIYNPYTKRWQYTKDGDGLRAIDEWRGYSEVDGGELKSRLNCYEIEKFVKFGKPKEFIDNKGREKNYFSQRDIF